MTTNYHVLLYGSHGGEVILKGSVGSVLYSATISVLCGGDTSVRT